MIGYRHLTLGCFVAGVVLNVAVVAQLPEESARPLGLEMFSVGREAERLTFRPSADDSSIRSQPLRELRRRGLEIFATPFTKADGFGDGVFNSKEVPSSLPGNRPTLQGNGTTLRVNGLDAQSCNECHTIVSNATVPPTLGIGGVGGMVQNALILPTVIDVADSADSRVAGLAPLGGTMMADGIAEFNGRLANPPFLFGGGGVELLGKEMTLDLQFLLQRAREAPVGTVTSLDTHGINFGVLTTQAAGEVDLSRVVGIGFKDNVGRRPEDVLVVRPFGRKGENFSMRDFDRGAMQFHFGIQPVEVVGDGVDLDNDGVSNEISVESMTHCTCSMSPTRGRSWSL